MPTSFITSDKDNRATATPDLSRKYSSTRTLISKSAAGFQGTPRVSRICSIPVSWMSISTTPMGGCRIERFALNTRYDPGRFKIAEPSTIVTKIFLTPGSSSTNIFGPGSHSPMQRWLRTNIRTSAPGMTGPTTLSICPATTALHEKYIARQTGEADELGRPARNISIHRYGQGNRGSHGCAGNEIAAFFHG